MPKLTVLEQKIKTLKEAGITSAVICRRLKISKETLVETWRAIREKTGAEQRSPGRPHTDGKTQKKKGKK